MPCYCFQSLGRGVNKAGRRPQCFIPRTPVPFKLKLIRLRRVTFQNKWLPSRQAIPQELPANGVIPLYDASGMIAGTIANGQTNLLDSNSTQAEKSTAYQFPSEIGVSGQATGAGALGRQQPPKVIFQVAEVQEEAAI